MISRRGRAISSPPILVVLGSVNTWGEGRGGGEGEERDKEERDKEERGRGGDGRGSGEGEEGGESDGGEDITLHVKCKADETDHIFVQVFAHNEFWWS